MVGLCQYDTDCLWNLLPLYCKDWWRRQRWCQACMCSHSQLLSTCIFLSLFSLTKTLPYAQRFMCSFWPLKLLLSSVCELSHAEWACVFALFAFSASKNNKLVKIMIIFSLTLFCHKVFWRENKLTSSPLFSWNHIQLRAAGHRSTTPSNTPHSDYSHVGKWTLKMWTFSKKEQGAGAVHEPPVAHSWSMTRVTGEAGNVHKPTTFYH